MGWRMFLIICSSSFLLGSTFVHWTADHNTLWRSPLTLPALRASLDYYTILSISPVSTALGWVWVSVLAVAMGAVGWRVVGGMRNEGGEGDGGGFVFDGGSLVLLLAVAFTQIRDVFPVISTIPFLSASIPNHILNPSHSHPHSTSTNVQQTSILPASLEPLGELVQRLAGSNAVVSVALTGVMLLQAGRTYADRSDRKARLAASAARRPNGITTTSKQSPASLTNPGSASTSASSASTSTAARRTDSPRRRAATPHRELSQDEAMELRSLDEAQNGDRDGAEGGKGDGDGVEVTVARETVGVNGGAAPSSPVGLQREGLRIPRRAKRV